MFDKPIQTEYTRAAPQRTPTWALVLINGIAAIGIGLLFLVSPQATAKIIAKFLGLLLLIGGFSAFMSMAFSSEHRWLKFFAGIAGVIGGLIVMEHPLWSSLLGGTVLVLTVAGLGIVMGVLHLIQAFQGAGWGQGILGALFFVFGLILLFSPVIGAVALPFVMAAFGIVGGIVAVIYAFRMRKVDHQKSPETV
jgi:uncharacterized membrane protein HdeD (DUF308 family)